jgi:hypothetical protein
MSLTVTRRPQQAVTLNKWSCVHLPIVYELTSNKYPNNTSDPSSGVAAYNSNNGYLRVDLGGIGTINELDFIKISAPNRPEFDGVHQVLQVESGNVYTLDIAYTSGTIDWTGSSFTKYYPNYHAVVRVYAGLIPSHPLQDDKPIELAAELKITPDANGVCLFSIHEILRAYVETRNTRVDIPPIGDVDPFNDIDFFTYFYIEYAESYDESNAYTIGTFQSSFTQDSFTGIAVNASLAFRNSNGTFLTDYMNNKFLTLFAIPVLFACSQETPNCFQDISFITQDFDNKKLKQEYYSNGVKVTETLTDIPDEGEGLYRAPLTEADCDYDRVDVSVLGDVIDVQDFSNFGTGTSWAANGSDNPEVALSASTIGVPSSSKYLGTPVTVRAGQSISVNYKLVLSNASPTGWQFPFSLVLLDADGNVISGTFLSVSGITAEGTYTGLYTATPSQDASYIGIIASLIMTAPVGGVNATYTVENSDSPSLVPLTETKTFDVECGCSNQEMRLVWVNNLGGLDYWNFKAQKEFGVDIMRTEEVSVNKLLIDWANDDTIRKEVARESREYVVVRSQHLTLSQLQALKYIRSSILVQQIFSAGSRRTVLIDNSSFKAYDEGDKLYTIEFRISFTDDIPVQRG